MDKIDFSQHPIANSRNNPVKRELPIEVIDRIADELVAEYDNPKFRRWYCGVIKDFGFSRVHEWRRRASEGGEPGKLFSKYVTQARKFNQGTGTHE